MGVKEMKDKRFGSAPIKDPYDEISRLLARTIADHVWHNRGDSPYLEALKQAHETGYSKVIIFDKKENSAD